MKILEKWKKHLEISSLYTCATEIKIIWCMVPDISSVTDRIFHHFRLFFVQNFIGSRLRLSAALPVSLADLLNRNIGLLFTVKIYCQIYVPFFQDSSFNWCLKRKRHFIFFPFLFLTCTLLNAQKIIGSFQY